jgi:Spy/CpxP family protein refolding chaperone
MIGNQMKRFVIATILTLVSFSCFANEPAKPEEPHAECHGTNCPQHQEEHKAN